MKQTTKIEYKRAVIYCRVSSERQVKEGTGLDSQEQRCIKYALDRGLTVAQVFRDEGISGGLFDRPAMQELIQYLDMNPSEKFVVIFDDLKRFARDVRVHLQLRTELGSREAKPECLNFNFEDSPEGMFVETIIAATAQLEREQNKRQVIQKQRARLEAGYWSFCAPPGLKYSRDPIKGKILVPNEPLASIYKEAIIQFAEYKLNTLDQVREFILNKYKAHGIDRKLSLHGVTSILTCPLYAGLIEYEPWDIPRMQGQHQSFIPLDLFYAVQKKFGNSAKPRLRKDYKEDFPLRNYILCTECKRAMTASWHKGRAGVQYPHYWCKTETCLNRNKVIARKNVEGDFEKLIKKIKPRTEILNLAQAILMDIWKERENRESDKQLGASKEIVAIQKKIDFFLDRISEAETKSVITHYEQEITKLANKKTALEAELARERYSRQQFGKASALVFEHLQDPWGQWKNPDYEKKRIMLAMYFEKGIEYHRTKGLVKPELPLLVQVSLQKNFGSNNFNLVEMEGVKPSSRTWFTTHCSQD